LGIADSQSVGGINRSAEKGRLGNNNDRDKSDGKHDCCVEPSGEEASLVATDLKEKQQKKNRHKESHKTDEAKNGRNWW